MLLTIEKTQKVLNSNKANDLIKFLIDNVNDLNLDTPLDLLECISEDLQEIVIFKKLFPEFTEFTNDFYETMGGVGLDYYGMLNLNGTSNYLKQLIKPEYNDLDTELLKLLTKDNLGFTLKLDDELKKDWDKVLVSDRGGGWYSFSPSGHNFLFANDDLKVRGKTNLINTLNYYYVLGVGKDRYGKEIIYNL